MCDDAPGDPPRGRRAFTGRLTRHPVVPRRRPDQGLARRHEGTGLGLPLVAKLIELHGGSLTLESAPGKGTAAILRFPGERLLG